MNLGTKDDSKVRVRFFVGFHALCLLCLLLGSVKTVGDILTHHLDWVVVLLGGMTCSVALVLIAGKLTEFEGDLWVFFTVLATIGLTIFTVIFYVILFVGLYNFGRYHTLELVLVILSAFYTTAHENIVIYDADRLKWQWFFRWFPDLVWKREQVLLPDSDFV